MSKPPNLGTLQQLTMLAVTRLQGQAFGGAIQDELGRVAGREVAVSTIYVTLTRLEDQGFVTSQKAEPDPGRGGKGKRFYSLTPEGREALQASLEALQNMWKGVSPA
jgi:DNA-binding PadR family transcriptional regulator